MTESLLLPSLRIRNYRAFEDLEISTLGRVNLIVGQNNIGKTSLLEAVWLWASRGDWDVIRTIMEARNENIVADPTLRNSNSGELMGLTHLFNGHPVFTSDMQEIEFEISPTFFATNKLRFSFSTIKYAVENKILDEYQLFPRGNIRCDVCLSVGMDGISHSVITALHGEPVRKESPSFPRIQWRSLPACFVYSTGDARLTKLRNLWDRVQMNNQEEMVLKGLEILDTRIEKIFFFTSQENSHAPMCKLKECNPIPLRNLGGGVIRVFEILLALVNSQGGVLLIDEVENGLHYKIQRNAWEVIFEMARRLNVQVFATTHSTDAVQSFQQVALQQQDEKAGVVVQLTKFSKGIVANPLFGDDIRLMYYSEEDLR